MCLWQLALLLPECGRVSIVSCLSDVHIVCITALRRRRRLLATGPFISYLGSESGRLEAMFCVFFFGFGGGFWGV